MSIMSARTNLMSDDYLKSYVSSVAKKVKELNSLLEVNSLPILGCTVDSILVYSEEDFLRIADLFNLKIAKKEMTEDFSYKYAFQVLCCGVVFRIFTDEELI